MPLYSWVDLASFPVRDYLAVSVKIRLHWFTILWMRWWLHRVLPLSSACTSRADVPYGEGLSPFTSLHSLLKARLSLALNYRYVVRDILSIGCESCLMTAARQITHCVSTSTACCCEICPCQTSNTRLLIQKQGLCYFTEIGKHLI